MNLDIIRIIALFCVISVHFFSYIEFYNEPTFGMKMFVMTVMRDYFMICVPLFILLTGYLMCNKKLDIKYYKGIIKTVSIYVLASIVNLIYRKVFLNEDITIINSIVKILDFSGAKYSWYIEMYIGLFVLIPFLNIIYNNLESKRQKQGLIATFLCLTAIPPVLNNTIHSQLELLPNWWESLYPITYYFIGCYLRENKIYINKWFNIILITLISIILGGINYFFSYSNAFVWGNYQTYGSLFVTALAILTYIFILNLNTEKINRVFSGFLAKLSNLVLGAYLVSFVFDDIVYNFFNTKIDGVTERMNYYFIVVPIIFVCSLLLSFILEIIFDFIKKIMVYIYNMYSSKQKI